MNVPLHENKCVFTRIPCSTGIRPAFNCMLHTPFLGKVKVRHVAEAKVDKHGNFFLSHVIFDALEWDTCTTPEHMGLKYTSCWYTYNCQHIH